MSLSSDPTSVSSWLSRQQFDTCDSDIYCFTLRILSKEDSSIKRKGRFSQRCKVLIECKYHNLFPVTNNTTAENESDWEHLGEDLLMCRLYFKCNNIGKQWSKLGHKIVYTKENKPLKRKMPNEFLNRNETRASTCGPCDIWEVLRT